MTARAMFNFVRTAQRHRRGPLQRGTAGRDCAVSGTVRVSWNGDPRGLKMFRCHVAGDCIGPSPSPT